MQFSIYQDPRTTRDAIGLIDLSMGLRNQEQGWDMSLFVKNLTDEFYPARRQFVQAIGGPYHSLSREYQRYIGLKFALRFGSER